MISVLIAAVLAGCAKIMPTSLGRLIQWVASAERECRASVYALMALKSPTLVR